jgi:hypothetical protein
MSMNEARMYGFVCNWLRQVDTMQVTLTSKILTVSMLFSHLVLTVNKSWPAYVMTIAVYRLLGNRSGFGAVNPKLVLFWAEMRFVSLWSTLHHCLTVILRSTVIVGVGVCQHLLRST